MGPTLLAEAAERLLIMPADDYPMTCGKKSCCHIACIVVREHVRRRCERCNGLIASGQRFIAHRDRKGDLVSQRHEVCPEVSA